MRSAFSSCLLYSWMRLIWQSKIVSESTISPDVDFSQLANFTLASRFDLRNSSRALESSANDLSSLSWLLESNPALSGAITQVIGERWITDLNQLSELRSFAEASSARELSLKSKRKAKCKFADRLKS